MTFALTSGGHNAGVVSGAQHSRRRYRLATRTAGDRYTDPDSGMDSHSIDPVLVAGPGCLPRRAHEQSGGSPGDGRQAERAQSPCVMLRERAFSVEVPTWRR